MCRKIIHSKLNGHFSTTASMFYSYNPPLVVDSRLLRHRDHRRGRQRNRHLDRYRYAHFCKLFSRIYGKVSCFKILLYDCKLFSHVYFLLTVCRIPDIVCNKPPDARFIPTKKYSNFVKNEFLGNISCIIFSTAPLNSSRAQFGRFEFLHLHCEGY